MNLPNGVAIERSVFNHEVSAMNTRTFFLGSILALAVAAPSLATTDYRISGVQLLRDAVNSEAPTAAETDAALTPPPIEFGSRDTASEAAMLGVVEAEAISWNDSGTVVGSAVTSQGRRFAFVWDEASGMSDLNRFASDAATSQLEEAVSIDDSGRIIVKGLSNGEDAEFELSPTHSAKAPTSRGLCGSFSGLEAAGGALGLIFMSALSLTRRRRSV